MRSLVNKAAWCMTCMQATHDDVCPAALPYCTLAKPSAYILYRHIMLHEAHQEHGVVSRTLCRTPSRAQAHFTQTVLELGPPRHYDSNFYEAAHKLIKTAYR